MSVLVPKAQLSISFPSLKMGFPVPMNMFGPVNVDISDFTDVIDLLRGKVAHHVSRLLADHVDIDGLISDPWPAQRKKYGLTCVKITNDDLP